MFKYVFRVWRRAACMDQVGTHQLAESVLQRRPVDRRDCFQQAIGNLAPDRRPDLRDLLDMRETIQARNQRVSARSKG